jgi:hypothetical protein
VPDLALAYDATVALDAPVIGALSSTTGGVAVAHYRLTSWPATRPPTGPSR